MKATVTPEAENAIVDIAHRYGLSRESVLAMLSAVDAGGGTMAQFSIPELGGSGQWMRGGMTMVGTMFDTALRARVDGLCGELAQLLATTPVFPPSTTDHRVGFTSASWWPADLGAPSASGGQNDARYAIFPSTQRLAIQIDGVTRVLDTGKHRIAGVRQQQGAGYGSVSFTSQLGTFDVSSLPELDVRQVAETPTAAPAARYQSDEAPRSAPQAQAPEPSSGASGASRDSAAIVAAIESLAALHQRGIVSDEEFATKKAELLRRL